jgi:hypothetical protein
MFNDLESSMFTVLMSLGLLGLVALSGVVYSKTMDEMLSESAKLAGGASRV